MSCVFSFQLTIAVDWLFGGGIPLVHSGFQTSLSFKKEEMLLWLTNIKLYKKMLNNFYIHVYQLNVYQLNLATHATNTAMGLWPRTGWTSQPKPHVKESKGRAIWSDTAVLFPDEVPGAENLLQRFYKPV